MTFPPHPAAPASPRRPAAAVAVVAALLLCGAPTPARGALIVQVQNSIASPGGTGSFDVTLADTAGTFAVSGFQVKLSVLGVSGVQFTGVNGSTTAAPYLFGTVQFPPLSFDTFPNTTFTASDSDATPPFFVTLTAGQTFGLEHVTYSVAAGTSPGPVPVSIVTGGTMLFDNATPIPNTIPYTPVNGTITVTAVPEPSSLVLCGLGAVALAGYARRRRSARA